MDCSLRSPAGLLDKNVTGRKSQGESYGGPLRAFAAAFPVDLVPAIPGNKRWAVRDSGSRLRRK